MTSSPPRVGAAKDRRRAPGEAARVRPCAPPEEERHLCAGPDQLRSGGRRQPTIPQPSNPLPVRTIRTVPITRVPPVARAFPSSKLRGAHRGAHRGAPPWRPRDKEAGAGAGVAAGCRSGAPPRRPRSRPRPRARREAGGPPGPARVHPRVHVRPFAGAEESRSRGDRPPSIPQPPGCGGRPAAGPDKRRCRGGESSRPPRGLPGCSVLSPCATTKRSLLPLLLLLCFSAAEKPVGTCETTPKAACVGKIADASTCTTAHVTGSDGCTFTEGTGGAANTCTTTPLPACDPAKQGTSCTDAGYCTFVRARLLNPESGQAISTFNRASWDYVQDPTTAVDKWGNIEDWDTSRVVSMRLVIWAGAECGWVGRWGGVGSARRARLFSQA